MAIEFYDSLNVDSNDDSYFLGEVGIGNTSPSQKLHVTGSVRVTGAYYDSSNLAGTSGQVLSSTATGTSWIDQSTITANNAEHVVIYAKNTSGASISKGTPVYITGTVGATDTVEIAPADAGNSAKMPAVGLLDDTLANNAFGYVITGGFMDNITTDPIDGATPSSNDTVYVKVGGGLTLTKPTGVTGLIQNVAKVGKVSGGNAGSLIVSSILRTNDVPNLSTGKIWVGDGNTTESTVVHLDETNVRMGIGTTSPGAKLEVSDSSGATLMINTDGGSNADSTLNFLENNVDRASIKWDGADNDLRLTTETGDFTMNPSGNVGIGTNSPTAKLDVNGTVNLTNLTVSSSQGTDGQVLTSTGSGVAWEDVSGGSSPWVADTNGITYTAGNVGIGTASQATLDLAVNGAARFNSDVRLDESLLDVNGATGTSGQILSSEGAGGGVEWIDAPSGTVTSITATSGALGGLTGGTITTSGSIAIDYSGNNNFIFASGSEKTAVSTSDYIAVVDMDTPSRPVKYASVSKLPVNGVDSTTTGEPTGADSITNIVSLTQAEYDAGTPVATTLYIIT